MSPTGLTRLVLDNWHEGLAAAARRIKLLALLRFYASPSPGHNCVIRFLSETDASVCTEIFSGISQLRGAVD